MATSVSNEHIEHTNLDYVAVPLPKNIGEAGDSSVRLVQSRDTQNIDDSNKDLQYELTLRHVQGENVFWQGGYDLKSEVTFKGNVTAFPLSVDTIIGKYLARDYFHTKESSEEILLIRENFQPISMDESFASLFQDGEPRTTIFVRSPDSSLNKKKNTVSQNVSNNNMANTNTSKVLLKPEVKSNLTLVEDPNDLIVITFEEVSGRRIVWDENNKVFDSVVQIQFPRAQLSTLRVDTVLSRIMPKKYIETSTNVIEKHIWTDKIKVVGLKDTLDVVCQSANKVNLYLKYIRNSDDQQWQEILDAINQFKEKVSFSDDELKTYYEDNCVFDDMDELKRKIQSDSRDEDEIQAMMLKLEPKLNLALTFISTMEESEVDNEPGVDNSTTDPDSTIDLTPSLSQHSQCSNSSSYEDSCVDFQFYHW